MIEIDAHFGNHTFVAPNDKRFKSNLFRCLTAALMDGQESTTTSLK